MIYNRIRIVHIAECAGGVDRYIRALLEKMNRDRFEHILLCSKTFDEKDYKELVKEFIVINTMNNNLSFNDFKAMLEVRRHLKQLKPDVIYCHSSKAGGIGRIANIGLGYKVLYNPHGWAFNMPSGMKPRFYAFLERMLSKVTDRIIAVSNFEKINALDKHICKAKKIKVIVSGIDREELSKMASEGNVTRTSLGIPQDAYVIGSSARLCETKAQDIMIKAAVEIKKEIPEAFFLMIGDGEKREEIENLAVKYELEKCLKITGWVDNPMPYERLLDQGWLLSRWEGFGLALTEYMLLRKPILATEVCAIPELIINRENGMLVAMDNIEEIVKASIEIYKNKSLRDKIVENSYRRVCALYDVNRVALEHEMLINKMCEK